jgi:hypothetical protein
MRPLALVLACAAAAGAGPARAGPSITLNGVSIDGVTSQRFENATVTIDAAGAVHIEARGYAVRGAAAPQPPDPASSAAGPAAAPAAEPRLARRYFLATEQSQPDGTQFDVEVFVNATWIRVIRSSDPQVVVEITRYLRPGRNTITLASTKRLQGVARRFYGPDVTLRVVVGEGNVGGDHVVIEAPLVVMTRTAAEVDDRVQEFALEAR